VGGWYGDICQYLGTPFRTLSTCLTNQVLVEVPINVTANDTSPVVSIKLGNEENAKDSGDVVFSLEFTNVQEVDANGSILPLLSLFLSFLFFCLFVVFLFLFCFCIFFYFYRNPKKLSA